MQELASFAELGFRHIADFRAMDHMLFLLALSAVYSARDWRATLVVVTAFTVGHSITLALAVTGVMPLPTALIEFLIPVTILFTCVENIVAVSRKRGPVLPRGRPLFAGIFGLVHGAGFANYLRQVFTDGIALPLVGFNIGIEIGQIVVLAIIAAALFAADRMIRLIRAASAPAQALRVRVLAVSVVVLVVSLRWAVDRSPW